jgi:hypothetical protein
MRLFSLVVIALIVCVAGVVRADTPDQIIHQAHLDYQACSSQAQAQYQQCIAPCGGMFGNQVCVNACFNATKAQTNACRTTRDSTIQQAIDQSQQK